MKKNTKVLIVDDDKISRDLVGEIVSGLGYQMLKCSSCEDAKKAFQSHGPFHLVVTDLYMPNKKGKMSMMGCELASFVNKKSNDCCPIIVLSSETNPLVQLKLFFSGGSLFVTKLMKKEMLSAKISKYAQLGRWCQLCNETSNLKLFSGDKKHA